ncbi:hypothetical protein LMG33810_002428 [Carnimonas sp. LMG 33810]
MPYKHSYPIINYRHMCPFDENGHMQIGFTIEGEVKRYFLHKRDAISLVYGLVEYLAGPPNMDFEVVSDANPQCHQEN